MKIMLDKGAKMPTRSHPFDAGLDLRTPIDCTIPAATTEIRFDADEHSWKTWTEVGSVTIDTGVHVQIPEGCYGEIRSRSGMMVTHNVVTDGTIDAHYNGSIRVKLFNLGNKDYKVQAGDKIAQLVIVPCVLLPLELTDSFEETDRGDRGFGSTGR